MPNISNLAHVFVNWVYGIDLRFRKFIRVAALAVI
jgi:hypothetical protein